MRQYNNAPKPEDRSQEYYLSVLKESDVVEAVYREFPFLPAELKRNDSLRRPDQKEVPQTYSSSIPLEIAAKIVQYQSEYRAERMADAMGCLLALSSYGNLSAFEAYRGLIYFVRYRGEGEIDLKKSLDIFISRVQGTKSQRPSVFSNGLKSHTAFNEEDKRNFVRDLGKDYNEAQFLNGIVPMLKDLDVRALIPGFDNLFFLSHEKTINLEIPTVLESVNPLVKASFRYSEKIINILEAVKNREQDSNFPFESHLKVFLEKNPKELEAFHYIEDVQLYYLLSARLEKDPDLFFNNEKFNNFINELKDLPQFANYKESLVGFLGNGRRKEESLIDNLQRVEPFRHLFARNAFSELMGYIYGELRGGDLDHYLSLIPPKYYLKLQEMNSHQTGYVSPELRKQRNAEYIKMLMSFAALVGFNYQAMPQDEAYMLSSIVNSMQNSTWQSGLHPLRNLHDLGSLYTTFFDSLKKPTDILENYKRNYDLYLRT